MSTRCFALRRLHYTYGGEGEPKEYDRKSHNVVEPSSVLKSIPLDITGSSKETNENTCTTGSLLARNLNNWERNQALTVQNALQEDPKKERERVANSRHSKIARRMEGVTKVWVEEKESGSER